LSAFSPDSKVPVKEDHKYTRNPPTNDATDPLSMEIARTDMFFSAKTSDGVQLASDQVINTILSSRTDSTLALLAAITAKLPSAGAAAAPVFGGPLEIDLE
jgi:hypothetical protein